MSLLIFVGPNTTPDVDHFIGKFDKSILFEPSADSYRELCNRYPKREGLEIINAGCGATDGHFEFREYNGGLSSSFAKVTDEAKSLFARSEWDSGKVEIARMMNLGDLLRSRGIETVDLMIIDSQGYDFEILKTVESFLRTQSIKKLHTEADHRGFSHYDIENTFTQQKQFMESCGYICTRQVGHRHLDLTWEPIGNENQAIARMERAFTGLCV